MKITDDSTGSSPDAELLFDTYEFNGLTKDQHFLLYVKKCVAVITVIGALALSGCGHTIVIGGPAAEPTLSASQSKFKLVEVMQEAYPDDFTPESSSKFLGLARAICGAWDKGMTSHYMLKIAAESYTYTEGKFMVQQVTKYMCPEYSEKVS